MNLIAVVDNNWAIGNAGSLLVKIPEDQKRFRNLTTGKAIVLGRKTLAGFPNGIPLAERINVVLSGNPNFNVRGAEIVNSVDALFEKLKEYNSDDIFVVGGGMIFEMLYDYCDTAYITKLNYKYQADTYFPNLDLKENWEVVEESDEMTYFSIEYNYVTYKNKCPKLL